MKLILIMILVLASIKYGQTIDVNEEKLKIKFTSVLEDSRCPRGEQCIRAGSVSIKLEITKTNSKSISITLNTAGESQEVIAQGLEMKLVDLQPYPKSGVNIKNDDYVAILKLYKNTEQE
jgi:hypothetical protein